VCEQLAQNPGRTCIYAGFYQEINMLDVSDREGDEDSVQRVEPCGPKGRERGGVLGEWGSELVGLGSVVSSPSGVRGQSPGKFENWCNFRPQKSLQKCQIK